MNDRGRVIAAVGVTVLLFVGVQLGALALIEPFHDANYQAVENPEDPTNTLLYVGMIIVATGFMLAAFHYDLQWLIRGVIVFVSAMLAWYVFSVVLPPVVTVGGANVLALAAAGGVGLGLLLYPEWYVIDTAGVLMGAGAAGLFGISFGLLPAILLLVVLAVYDAISVYRTEHMLTLAEGVMDLKIPVVLVVPTTLSYSYLAADSTEGVIEGEGEEGDEDPDATPVSDGDGRADTREPDGPPAEREAVSDSGDGVGTDADPEAATAAGDDGDPDGAAAGLERDALFIGLGDAVIPTILVASAAYFLDAPAIDVPGLTLSVPALGAMLGTLAGLVVLMHMVLKGRAHAGLPLLNGGAITGYLIGATISGIPLVTALGV